MSYMIDRDDHNAQDDHDNRDDQDNDDHVVHFARDKLHGKCE